MIWQSRLSFFINLGQIFLSQWYIEGCLPSIRIWDKSKFFHKNRENYIHNYVPRSIIQNLTLLMISLVVSWIPRQLYTLNKYSNINSLLWRFSFLYIWSIKWYIFIPNTTGFTAFGIIFSISFRLITFFSSTFIHYDTNKIYKQKPVTSYLNLLLSVEMINWLLIL